MKKRILFWLKILLAAVAVLAVGTAVYLETIGLPAFGRDACREVLADRGLICDSSRVQIGLVRGIVMHDVVLRHVHHEGRELLTAERIQIRPSLGAMIQRNLRPARIQISNGTLRLPPLPDTSEESYSSQTPLMVVDLQLRARLSEKALALEQLTGSLEGISCSLQGVVAGLDAIKAPYRNERAVDRTLPDLTELYAATPEWTQAGLGLLHSFASDYLFLNDETFLRGTIDIDLADPAAAKAQGVLQVTDVAWNDVPVRRFKGQFVYENNSLSVRQATLDLGGNSLLRADLAMDFRARQISGTARGSLNPHLIYRIIGRPMPRILAEAAFPNPPVFDVRLHPSVLDDPANFEYSGNTRVHNVLYKGRNVRSVETAFKYAGGEFQLDNASVQFDSAGKETFAGSFAMNLQTHQFRLAADGVFYPSLVLDAFSVTSPVILDVMRDITFQGRPPQLKAEISGDSLQPEAWDGTLQVTATDVAFRDAQISRLDCPLQVQNGIITTAPHIFAAFDSKKTQFLQISATVKQHSKLFQASGKGSLFPKRLYNQLQLPEKRLIESLAFQQTPLQFEFNLDESSWDPAEWKGKGSLHAESLAFETLDVQKLDAELKLLPGLLELQNIRLTSADAKKLQADSIMLDLKTGELLVEAEITADPLIVEVFIAPGRSRRVFRKVWRDFQWGEEPPQMTVDRLYYWDKAPGIWVLEIDGRVVAENLTYRGLPVDALEARVDLELPAKVGVHILSATMGTETIEGTLLFELKGDPLLTFTGNGILNPVRAFSTVSPAVEAALESLATNAQTKTDISGTIHLRGMPRPRLKGSLVGNYLQYETLTFGNFKADWQMIESDLKWHLRDADMHGGRITVHGGYSGFHGTGNLEVTADKIALASLVSELSGTKVEKKLGRLSGSVAVDLNRREKGAPLRMVGSGELDIGDGNLWEAPLLQALGDTVAIPTLGRITSLNANLEFAGDHVLFNDIATNGTILALSGSGRYRWEDHHVNFKIYGQALKSTSLIPWLLTPVSSFLEAELTGTLDDYSWKLLGPLRRMLPGDQK